MPIKYIGRKTSYKGKPLWEILGNLKNFGVGRMVIRSQFQRYPEACYIRILKVAALPHTDDNPHNPRKVVTLVEKTFRGKTAEKPGQIDSVSYKPDYILIPKDEEARYLNAKDTPVERVLPKTTEFPPLLKELLIRQEREKGSSSTEEQKLKIRYNLTGIKFYKVAEENETPTVEVKAPKPTS